MISKKVVPLYVFLLICSLSGYSEVLTWKANVGQQYEASVTVVESVTGLDAITSKPVLITKAAPYQEEAATAKTTLSYIQSLISFPRGSIQVGESWKGEAQISYNLSPFGFESPVIINTEITYTLIGTEDVDSRTYFKIEARWAPFIIFPDATAKRSGISRLNGVSTMNLLWDNKAGGPKQTRIVEELQYRFTDNTSFLHSVKTDQDFRTVTDIVREQIISELKKEILSSKVENVDVLQTEEGIVLSIENIQFEPDSAVLTQSEKTKLSNIGKILASLKNRKISILGHAANPSGSNEEELLVLSAERAKSVASYFVETGVKTEDEVISKGMGGSAPIDTNETAEGRSRNRRVEIIILDEETKE